MAIQLDEFTRNNILNGIEASVGLSPVLKIRSGSAPANCAAADSGTVLATIDLPVDWLGAALSGSKSLLGSWATSAADNNGTAAHFRIYANGGTVCRMQGTVTATGGGGDMTLDDAAIVAGNSVAISTFSLTAGNA